MNMATDTVMQVIIHVFIEATKAAVQALMAREEMKQLGTEVKKQAQDAG